MRPDLVIYCHGRRQLARWAWRYEAWICGCCGTRLRWLAWYNGGGERCVVICG